MSATLGSLDKRDAVVRHCKDRIERCRKGLPVGEEDGTGVGVVEEHLPSCKVNQHADLCRGLDQLHRLGLTCVQEPELLVVAREHPGGSVEAQADLVARPLPWQRAVANPQLVGAALLHADLPRLEPCLESCSSQSVGPVVKSVGAV